MSASKFFYINISAVDTGQLTYDCSPLTIGEILFAIGAIKDSENYSSYEDMFLNYNEPELIIDLSNPNLKIPMLKIHLEDMGNTVELCCLLDTLFTNDRIDRSSPAGYGVCHTAPSLNRYIRINMDGSISFPMSE